MFKHSEVMISHLNKLPNTFNVVYVWEMGFLGKRKCELFLIVFVCTNLVLYIHIAIFSTVPMSIMVIANVNMSQ